MPDVPIDPKAIADGVLAAVVTAFADVAVTLPGRQYVGAGLLPAWDRDQLTVHLQRVYAGTPGQEQGQAVPWQHGILSMQLLVQLVRKAQGTLASAPRRSMPSRDSLSSDAVTYFRDAQLLAGALQTWKRSRKQGSAKVGPVVAPEQQGEFVGLSAFVDVLLV